MAGAVADSNRGKERRKRPGVATALPLQSVIRKRGEKEGE